MNPTISLAPDGRLQLEFPTTHAWHGWNIKIWATEGGLRLLVEILQHQANGEGQLMQRGAPTQAIIDQWLREDKAKRKEKAKTELGFELPEVEL